MNIILYTLILKNCQASLKEKLQEESIFKHLGNHTIMPMRCSPSAEWKRVDGCEELLLVCRVYSLMVEN